MILSQDWISRGALAVHEAQAPVRRQDGSAHDLSQLVSHIEWGGPP